MSASLPVFLKYYFFFLYYVFCTRLYDLYKYAVFCKSYLDASIVLKLYIRAYFWKTDFYQVVLQQLGNFSKLSTKVKVMVHVELEESICMVYYVEHIKTKFFKIPVPPDDNSRPS